MATRTVLTLEDDLDGGRADETLRFALGGAEYEIDLSKKNARAFRRQLAPFVEHARKAGGKRVATPADAFGVGPRAQHRDPGVGQGAGHRGQ